MFTLSLFVVFDMLGFNEGEPEDYKILLMDCKKIEHKKTNMQYIVIKWDKRQLSTL